MLNLTLDTCCVIAAIEDNDPDHLVMRELDDLARDHRDRLVLSVIDPAIEYNLEYQSDRLEAGIRRRWLDDRVYVRRLSGVATIEMSRFNSGDVLISEERADRLTEFESVLDFKWRDDRRKNIDLHHLRGHVYHDGNIFVTSDKKELFKRSNRVALAGVGVTVMFPCDALSRARAALAAGHPEGVTE